VVQLDPKPGRVDSFEPLGLPLKRTHLTFVAPFGREPFAVLRGAAGEQIAAKKALGLQFAAQDFLVLPGGRVGLDRLPVPRGGVEIAAHVDERAAGLVPKPAFEPLARLVAGRMEVVGEPDDAIGTATKPRREHSPGEDRVSGPLEHLAQHARAVHARPGGPGVARSLAVDGVDVIRAAAGAQEEQAENCQRGEHQRKDRSGAIAAGGLRSRKRLSARWFVFATPYSHLSSPHSLLPTHAASSATNDSNSSRCDQTDSNRARSIA